MVLELVSLDHGNEGILDGPLIIVPVHQLLLELWIRDSRADRNSSLDCVFDPPHKTL